MSWRRLALNFLNEVIITVSLERFRALLTLLYLFLNLFPRNFERG
jgi:hypothetical protein